MVSSIVTAWRSLERKRFRTLLVILSISISAASMILIMTIGETGKAAVRSELDSLGLGSLSVSADSRVGRTSLEAGELQVIASVDAVEEAVPIIMEHTNISMRRLIAESVVWGIDSGGGQIISLEKRYGRLFEPSDIIDASNVCVIDVSVAQTFYGRDNIVGKTIKLLFDGGYEEFEIIGVAESGGSMLQDIISEYLPTFIYIPYTTMQVSAGRSSYDQAAVKVREGADLNMTATRITNALYEYSGVKNGFRVENVAEQKASLENLLNIVTAVLSLIAGISLIVAGLGIMTVMLVSVNERTREIGIKKSIGASFRHIMSEFLAEAFTMSLFGSIIGALSGVALSFMGCAIFRLEIAFSWGTVLLSMGFSLAVGVLFGVYPSAKAAQLDPVEALRRE